MALSRITQHEADEVERLKGLGRTNRQIEKIVARIPMGRLGRAYDIARGVVFLTADDADFITGSTLTVNGGQYLP